MTLPDDDLPRLRIDRLTERIDQSQGLQTKFLPSIAQTVRFGLP